METFLNASGRLSVTTWHGSTQATTSHWPDASGRRSLLRFRIFCLVKGTLLTVLSAVTPAAASFHEVPQLPWRVACEGYTQSLACLIHGRVGDYLTGWCDVTRKGDERVSFFLMSM